MSAMGGIFCKLSQLFETYSEFIILAPSSLSAGHQLYHQFGIKYGAITTPLWQFVTLPTFFLLTSVWYLIV